MNKEYFEKEAREESKSMLKKKAPTKPDTQFMKGAMWAWDLFMEQKEVIYYEHILRADVKDRCGDVEPWQELLITETAKMMVDRDGMEQDIRDTGRLIEKHDKNMVPYKESNPLYVHLKELQRSIGMQREHLGLSFKVNPSRIKESPRAGVDADKDGLRNAITEARETMNEVPEL